MKSDLKNSIEDDDLQTPDADRGDRQFSRLSLRYNDMLRSAVDWLWETDARLNLTFVSPPIATTLGIPAQMLIGRNLHHLFGLEKGGRANGRMAAAIAARRSFRDEHFELDVDDGTRTSYRITGVPYYEEAKGRFAGYRGTGTAMSEAAACIDDNADDAGQLVEMLDSALARKDQLEWELSKVGDETLQSRLAGIAHELRTPLNAIIGFAEVIKEQHLGDDPQRCQDYARDIHESGLHLLEIVNDLIDLAKIDAGYQDLEAERLDVEPIVSSAFRMLKVKAREAGLELVNEVAPGTPMVRGERHALRQILLNLLTNAIKYTPTGGAVGAECRVEGTEMLDLTVWDTGVGIAPEELERVFERSYRVPQQGIERPGSGLGLSIARNLARAMSGEIVIASRTGKGTRVTLRMPLGQEPNSTEDSSD